MALSCSESTMNAVKRLRVAQTVNRMNGMKKAQAHGY
jgi:hypothetical protein